MRIWIVKWVEYGEMSDYYPAVAIYKTEEEALAKYEEMTDKAEAQEKEDTLDFSEGLLSEIHLDTYDL